MPERLRIGATGHYSSTMLDKAGEHSLTDACERLKEIFSERLLAAALYGSGAGADYVPGTSDINLVVVLDEVRPADLRNLRPHAKAWRRKGIATPLLLDRRFLEDAADVFPMELHDIQTQHRCLIGDDLFARLRVRDDHLRFQCEHEARGKLLRLRQLYLEIGDDSRRLKDLMLQSLRTFLIIMRNMIRLKTPGDTLSFTQVLATFEQQFHCAFPITSSLLRIKLSLASWEGDAEATFEKYCQELQQLVRVIDQLPPTSAATVDREPSDRS
jgi:predicted nucleotidyltransferase